jgi:disulfide bond formation protein DsbB
MGFAEIKRKKFMHHSIPLHRFLIIVGLFLVSLILVAALYLQFFHHEQPCPHCKFQRVSFILVALGLLMNLKYGERLAHWGLVLLGDAAGMAVSLRQIIYHVNDPHGFMQPIFGLHLPTWGFIGFAAILVGSGLLFLLPFEHPYGLK